MSHKLFAFILILIISVSVVAQTPAPETDNGVDANRQKEYIDFLNETLADVNNLRTLGNRISFSAELASLMWYYDERQARSMYLACIADFKELVGQYDMQMKSTVPTGEEDTEYYGRGILTDMPERARIARKFSSAMMVRQQIAMSIAEHDPDLAFSFYNESGEIASSPELRKLVQSRDTYFEFQLASRVAENNPGKAADFGSRSLKNGVESQHVTLLNDIYKQDREKGAEFAQQILTAVKTEKSSSSDLYILGSLLTAGAESYDSSKKNVGQKSMFSEDDLRFLSERLAQAMLAADKSYDPTSQLKTVARFAPASAVQVRAKFRRNSTNTNSAAESVSKAAQEITNRMQQQKQQKEESEKTEKQFADDVQNIGNKDLPKAERQKIVDQARSIIARTSGRDKKIAALGMLAATVAKAGDKELAASIMKDAQSLVNPEPRNAQDFMLTWILASAYAESDPDKAFPLLQDTISRLNETISAFVKVGEFIDTQEELMQDDEVQVGLFGGSMVREMTKNLGIAQGTIRILAKADLAKTRNLTNSFDRPEARILAKMLVLRAILAKPGKPMTSDQSSAPEY